MWSSAITDHALKENHAIDWDSAKIVRKERDDQTRGKNETLFIRKVPNFNQDEGRYHLSHLYDAILEAAMHT